MRTTLAVLGALAIGVGLLAESGHGPAVAPASGDPVPQHTSLIVNGSGAWSVDGVAPMGWEALGCTPLRVRGAEPTWALVVGPENRAPGALEEGYLSQGFPVVSGALYVAACVARLEDVGGEVHLLISWYRGDHAWIGNTDDGWRVTGTADWVSFQVADTPPVGAGYGRVALRCDSATGTACFRSAAVRVAQPREWVKFPLVTDGPQRSARFLPAESKTLAEWYAGPPATIDPQSPGPSLTRPEAADGASRFIWGEAAPPPYAWKRFPSAHDVAPDAAALRAAPARAFLVATRWLLPLWFSDAAVEAFGSTDAFLAAVDAAAGDMANDVESPLLRYVAALWRTPDAVSFRQQAHDLETSYPDVDVRADQLLWLQAEAERAASAKTLASSLASADALVAGAAVAERRRGWLERARLHREAGDYAALAADTAHCIAEHPDGQAPGLVRVYEAECALYEGRYEDAWRLAGAALEAARGYGPELRQVVWLAELAQGVDGRPSPRFLGDDEDADGQWVGLRGSAGAFLIGPRSEHTTLGCLEWHAPEDEPRVTTGMPGIVARTMCRALPSELRHAPFQPIYECRTDTYWEDRGEIWGRAVDGPDLVVKFPVPPGVFRLSLLTGGYAVEVRLSGVRDPVATAPAAEGDPRLYREFLIVGPARYEVRLIRGSRLMTYLAGLFLDGCGPVAEAPRGAASDPIALGQEACAKWAEWLASPPGGPTERLAWLARQPMRPAQRDLDTAAAAVLRPVDDPRSIVRLFRVNKDSRAVHALGRVLAADRSKLGRLDARCVSWACGHVSGAQDAPGVYSLLSAWADALGAGGLDGLSRVVEESLDLTTIMAALRIRDERGVATVVERERLAQWLDQWRRTAEAQSVRQRAGASGA